MRDGNITPKYFTIFLMSIILVIIWKLVTLLKVFHDYYNNWRMATLLQAFYDFYNSEDGNITPKYFKISIHYPPLMLYGHLFCQTILSLLERCPLVRGSITCIYSTFCQESLSFLEGCPLHRASFKRGTTVTWRTATLLQTYIESSYPGKSLVMSSSTTCRSCMSSLSPFLSA